VQAKYQKRAFLRAVLRSTNTASIRGCSAAAGGWDADGVPRPTLALRIISQSLDDVPQNFNNVPQTLENVHQDLENARDVVENVAQDLVNVRHALENVAQGLEMLLQVLENAHQPLSGDQSKGAQAISISGIGFLSERASPSGEDT
jgi:hypothetical protein